MIRPLLFLLLGLGLAGCASSSHRDTPTRAQISDSTLPPMKTFGTPHPAPPVQSNGNIAADFLDLHFQLESGRTLPVLTRFEAPITVKVKIGRASCRERV